MHIKYIPYSQLAQSWMQPGSFVKFTRTCIIWQLIKFAIYNLKIIKIVAKGH